MHTSLRNASLRAAALGIITIGYGAIASATPITFGGPAPASWAVEGRARWGGSGFEGAVYKNGAAQSNLNPGGAPVWVKGDEYGFQLNYAASTGTVTWSLDFDKSGSFGSGEQLTYTETSWAGRNFSLVNLYLQAADGNSLQAKNIQINGTGFGPYTQSGNGIQQYLFTDDSGQFGDITVTGKLIFNGTGGFAQERPVLHVNLGDKVVPEPGSIGLFAAAGAAGLFAVRRRMKPADPRNQ